MAIVEGIAVGLGLHLGKKVIDWVWEAIKEGETPVSNQAGQVGYANLIEGRTLVGSNFTNLGVQTQALIAGDLYLQGTLLDSIYGDEVALILIMDETQQQTLLFAADVDGGYEVYLSPGIYSFVVFLMDPEADDILDAEIYAIGFPSGVDLSDIDEINMASEDEIWNLINDLPLEVTPGGPYTLDFLLLDTDLVPEFPKYFSELLGEGGQQGLDLTGTWAVEEEYEFGVTSAELYLVHSGSQLQGVTLIHDIMDDGSELILEQLVSGAVDGSEIVLAGTGYRVLRGSSAGYELDRWAGTIEGANTIRGISEDEAGTQGVFVMQRV